MMFSKSFKLLPVVRCVQYAAVEKCRKGCTSSLFIPGDRANESFATLQPYVDLDVRFQDIESLNENLSLRGLNIDLNKIKTSWNQLKSIRHYRKVMDKELSENRVKIKALKDPHLLEAFMIKHDELKTKFKGVTKQMWELEKVAVLGGLLLPNDIHSETPTSGEEKIVHTFGSKPPSNNRNHPSHLDIACKLDLIDYYDSSYYFLKNEAAQFELGINYFFMDDFKASGYIPMSNSDFGKSVVVEGVGLNPRDANSVFTLELESGLTDATSRLHLVGGASLVSFCAYLAKSVTLTKNLPLRYVATGRHYNPENDKGLHGLFSTWQSSAVETFVAVSDGGKVMDEFKSCLERTISLYESLGYHFRVEYLPPPSLKPWESLRASFQMYSCNLGCYIEVGCLSICDDFVSRRLLMCSEVHTNKPYGFLHVISGTLVSVPRLLGCLLEYDAENFKLPSKVKAVVF